MSISSRITSIENHIEEAYTEISRLGVDLTNVDKNIDNIADKLQDVYDDLPKVTDIGSSLSLTPTRKGGLSIIPKGACEQDSYSGKNKFGTGLTYSSSYLTIINPETNNFSYKTAWPATLVNKTNVGKIFKASTQYTISFRFKILSRPNTLGSANHNKFFTLYDTSTPSNTVIIAQDDRKNTGTLNTWYEYSNTFTTQVDLSNVVIYMYNYKDGDGVTQGEIEIDNLQIEEGSTATSWEKYVGGIPSPNPDYPQDIRVVTGDNEFVVSNKNLVDYNETQVTLVEDTTRTINLTPDNFPITLQAGTYVVSFPDLVCTNSNYTNTLGCQLIKQGGGNISLFVTNETKQVSFTLKEELTFTRFYLYIRGTDNTNATATFSKIQLELGTTATEYVEHAEQTYAIHLGTNYLAGIGTYKDEIVGKKDDWKIVRNIGKIDLSTINYREYSHNVPGYKRYSTTSPSEVPNIKYVSKNTEVGVGLAEKYVLTMGNGGSNKTNIIAIDVSMVSVCAQASPTGLFYYALATPVEETITDTTLITDLNNMYQAMGYDGTTNMTITSNPNNAQMEANISALKGE